MITRQFRQVDVFGSAPLLGNPLAVVLGADGMTTEQMAAFSAWTNLSECTFVLPPTTPDADYRVRIFSLTTELPFAGHPTLGTARAWLDARGVPRVAGRIVQECGVGLVPIRHEEPTLAFAAPPLRRTGPVDDAYLDQVVAALGLTRADVVDAQWIDNGPGWVAVRLASADAVLAVVPDPSPREGQWSIGVVGSHAPGFDAAIEVRAFFNDGGGVMREDPVTGSLNASLAQWLVGSGSLAAPYVARQGTALGRDGRVSVSEGEGDLWIGGKADIVVRGEVTF